MTHSQANAGQKCWRPKFGLRTLAVFVTLNCIYFGAWEVTKRHASWMKEQAPSNNQSVTITISDAKAPFPLIVRQDEYVIHWPKENEPTRGTVSFPRRYYFWLLGAKVKLPFESDWQER